MELLAWLWDLAVHLDVHLAAFVQQHGIWVYGLLFAIVFCETGLVVTPFLPGDSLLFVTGAVAAAGGMDIVLVMATLVAAALCGDNVNYWVGRTLGLRVFSRLINPAYLRRTHEFYERHGGKTIILARFLPILRTFAPFAAGMASMPYRRFVLFNVVGAVAWVVSMTLVGYLLARAIPDVERHVHIVAVIVVVLSFIPAMVEVWRARRRARLAPPSSDPQP
jgi:membrane-associated protein